MVSDVNPVNDGDDTPLLDLLDALVGERGRTAAARALGVNYRTMMNCYDSRRVSHRMRQVLEEFRDSAVANELGSEDEAEVQVDDGEGVAKGQGESLEQRVAAQADENRELRELVEGQARQLEELTNRVAELEGTGEQGGSVEAVDVADDRQIDPGKEWRPPQRGPGMPDAGVVTLEEQPDEEHAFGPAAPLVAEWRRVEEGVREGSAGSRVDRALAAVRRWELEAEMLEEYHLTLPPETHPLDDERRADHVRRRRRALAEARTELAMAERARRMRRALSLGLWRR